MIAVAATLFVGLPVVTVTVLRRVPLFSRISPIIPAYVFGLALAFLLPSSDGLYAVQDAVSSATVIIAIPLMLFTVDLGGWRRAGGPAIASMALAVVAVSLSVTVGHLLLGRFLPESAGIAGLLTAVYTGGTPNLAAIRTALAVDTSLYLTVHTADIVVSAIYILFMVSIGPAVFRHLVPGGRSVPSAKRSSPVAVHETPDDGRIDYTDLFRSGYRGESLRAIGAAILVVAVSAGVALLLAPGALTVAVILGVTTLALAASAVPAVRRLRTSFRLGEFLILVFAVTVGSMADIQEMLAASPAVIGYVAIAVFGSLAVHVLLGRLFRISAETVMVTSMSAICSPPFIGMLADAIPRPPVLAAGMTTGIIGYAVGNYLGVAIHALLSSL